MFMPVDDCSSQIDQVKHRAFKIAWFSPIGIVAQQLTVVSEVILVYA